MSQTRIAGYVRRNHRLRKLCFVLAQLAKPDNAFSSLKDAAVRQKVSAVWDQGDQVVAAHQVDDINEVHELDPVHQVEHKDERCDDIGRFRVDDDVSH